MKKPEEGRTGPAAQDIEATLEYRSDSNSSDSTQSNAATERMKDGQNLEVTAPRSDEIEKTIVRTQFDSPSDEQCADGDLNETLPSQRQLPVDTNTISVRPRHVLSSETHSDAVPDADVEADYRTLDLLGQGGMGTVHLAQQVALGREVALKQIRTRHRGVQSVKDEFLTETVITGKLEHPNIVPVYEVGSASDGGLFYSMKNIRGQSWSDTMGNLSLVENLEILLSVCDAIAFAHSEGVVHRDLKPQNIMTGGFGEVLVLDWGLAVLAGPNGIVTGEVAGTPGYMAPEMADPNGVVGLQSDVYQLGALLFKVLNAKVPHAGRSTQECLENVQKNVVEATDEERCRRLDPSGELSDIAARAMATHQEERFQSALEFQEAVRGFLAHRESLELSQGAHESLKEAESTGEYGHYSRAVFAFEESLNLWPGNEQAAEGARAARLVYASCAERSGDFDLALSLLDESTEERQEIRSRILAAKNERDARQARLRRMKQTLVVVTAVVVLVLLGAAFWIDRARQDAVNAEQLALHQKDNAVAARQEAVSNEQAAIAAGKRAERERQNAIRSSQEAARQRDSAVAAREAEEAQRRIAERNAYGSQMLLADRDWEVANIGRIRSLLERYKGHDDLTGFEWGFWNRRINSELLTLKGHSGIVTDVVLSEDGRLIVSGAAKAARVWNTETGAELFTLTGHAGSVESVAISPNGKWIASGSRDKTIRIWDADTGELLRELTGHTAIVQDLEFNPESTRLLSGSSDRTIRLWDVETGEPKGTIRNAGPVYSVCYIPGTPRRIAIGLRYGGVRIISGSGMTLRTMKIPGSSPVSVATSPDGHWLASASGIRVSVWNLDDENALPVECDGHVSVIYAVRFSPDGKTLATAGQENIVNLWDATTGQELQTIKGHSGSIRELAFHPDARRLVTASIDSTLRVWDLKTRRSEVAIEGISETETNSVASNHAAFSLDGSKVVTGGRDGLVKLWNAESGELLESYSGRTDGQGRLVPVGSIAFGPKGERVFVGRTNGFVGVLDLESREFNPFRPHEGTVSQMSFSRDGTRLVSVGTDRVPKLWDIDARRELHAFQGHTGTVYGLALSPDGQRMASAGYDGIRIWDVNSGEQVKMLQGHLNGARAVAFSPDSDSLASAGVDSVLILWDAESGDELRRLQGHSNIIRSVSFSADGTRLLSSSQDRTVKLWDVTTGQELLSLAETDGFSHESMFSPDGTRVMTVSSDGKARIWDSRSATTSDE